MKKSKKDKRDVTIAIVILISLIVFAAANSIICTSRLKALSSAVENTEYGDVVAAKMIREDFTRLAFLMSITVNHDDLEDAEECVIEFSEAIRSGDEVEIRLAKSRLVAALRQLGRLCGFNIDSII